MNTQRRRAMVILEMLTVAMVFLISSGLILLALESLLQAHGRVVDHSNRYAMINDLLVRLRNDIRRADSAELGTATTDDGPVQVLTLRRAVGGAVYRAGGHRLTRTAVGSDEETYEWNEPDLSVRFVDASATGERRALVRMIVTWKPTHPHDTAPGREFDITIATAGERDSGGISHE